MAPLARRNRRALDRRMAPSSSAPGRIAPRPSRSQRPRLVTTVQNDHRGEDMDRGRHAVQFLALINMMPNDNEIRTEVVFGSGRDIFVPGIHEANRAMNMSSALVRTPEAVGIARHTPSLERKPAGVRGMKRINTGSTAVRPHGVS